jgi:phage terminase large subunit
VSVAVSDIAVAPKIRELFSAPSRYKVAHGGRGSSKSWGFARELLLRSITKSIRILCARELQVSIKDSVHKLLSDQIDLLGWGPWFNITQHEISNDWGSEILFEGIRNNVTKIKSMEGIDIAWVEEAEKVSKESWKVLIPTIRTPGSEIWVSYNPDLPDDPTHQRFVMQTPPDARVIEINWPDNPWFPEELRKEKDYLYSVDPEAAENVWGGKTRKNSAAQVLKGKYIVETFEPQLGWDGPYIGVDWGFSQDPSAMIEMYICGRRLFIRREVWGVGIDIDRLPARFDEIPNARKYTSRADCARPETISYMQQHGYPNMIACEKWKGSVEDGVAHLRQYEQIVIHPSCRYTADEARLWSYKIDKLSGDVLPDLVDAHNHCWDAIRYGLGPMILSGRFAMLDFYKAEAEKAKGKNAA